MTQGVAIRNETDDISSAIFKEIIQGTTEADPLNSPQAYANDVLVSRHEMRVVPAPLSLPETGDLKNTNVESDTMKL